jgi:hypothetical protein
VRYATITYLTRGNAFGCRFAHKKARQAKLLGGLLGTNYASLMIQIM